MSASLPGATPRRRSDASRCSSWPTMPRHPQSCASAWTSSDSQTIVDSRHCHSGRRRQRQGAGSLLRSLASVPPLGQQRCSPAGSSATAAAGSTASRLPLGGAGGAPGSQVEPVPLARVAGPAVHLSTGAAPSCPRTLLISDSTRFTGCAWMSAIAVAPGVDGGRRDAHAVVSGRLWSAGCGVSRLYPYCWSCVVWVLSP